MKENNTIIAIKNSIDFYMDSGKKILYYYKYDNFKVIRTFFGTDEISIFNPILNEKIFVDSKDFITLFEYRDQKLENILK